MLIYKHKHWMKVLACWISWIILFVGVNPPSIIAKEHEDSNPAISANTKPLSLAELRKKYAETFKFKGPNVKQIALTFDDVPDPRFTPQVLEVLHQHKVRATFFVVGNRAKKHPELLRRIHREGHQIGNHSFTHPQFKKKSASYFKKEIERTERVIYHTIGYRPKFIRPPYGEINEQQVKWSKNSGYKIVNWNVDSMDWTGINKVNVTINVMKSAGPGSIILQHAGGGIGSNLTGTVEALPDIIKQLKAKGYEFVTLDELFSMKKY